jgi:hypothetical protein
MPVGRSARDAGDPTGIREREILRPALLHQPPRRADQRLAQLAVVVVDLSPYLLHGALHKDLKS